MHVLEGKNVVVTGGNRGLGLEMVKALLACNAQVTVVARDAARSEEVKLFGATVRLGDATDAELMDSVIAETKPSVLILNAGATPNMASIADQTWETFSAVWDTDVKAGLHGIQAAIKEPMPRDSRVLIMSSGAATVLDSPYVRPESIRLSGGYVGAKRILWLMAHYANYVSRERSLGIHFQALLPLQLMGGTIFGQHIAGAYAQLEGVSTESYLQSRYGMPLTPQDFGEQVSTFLEDSSYTTGVAFGFTRDAEITRLDK